LKRGGGGAAEKLIQEEFSSFTRNKMLLFRLVYCTGEAGGKESFIYLNPGGQDTKLEQVITRFSAVLKIRILRIILVSPSILSITYERSSKPSMFIELKFLILNEFY